MNSLIPELDRVTERTKDRRMIDPVEYGELKGAVNSLQMQVTEFKSKQSQMDAKLDIIVSQLSEAKGGWRTMMALGGAAGSVGAGIAWLITHFKV